MYQKCSILKVKCVELAVTFLIKVVIFFVIYKLVRSLLERIVVKSASPQNSDIIDAEFREIDPEDESKE